MAEASTGGGGTRPQSIPAAFSAFKHGVAVQAPHHLRQARTMRLRARKIRYHRLRTR